MGDEETNLEGALKRQTMFLFVLFCGLVMRAEEEALLEWARKRQNVLSLFCFEDVKEGRGDPHLGRGS